MWRANRFVRTTIFVFKKNKEKVIFHFKNVYQKTVLHFNCVVNWSSSLCYLHFLLSLGHCIVSMQNVYFLSEVCVVIVVYFVNNYTYRFKLTLFILIVLLWYSTKGGKWYCYWFSILIYCMAVLLLRSFKM